MNQLKDAESVRESLRDLTYVDCMITACEHNDQMFEAYRRGRAAVLASRQPAAKDVAKAVEAAQSSPLGVYRSALYAAGAALLEHEKAGMRDGGEGPLLKAAQQASNKIHRCDISGGLQDLDVALDAARERILAHSGAQPPSAPAQEQAGMRDGAGESIQAERVKSRLLGIEDAISAFSDESLLAENKILIEAIDEEMVSCHLGVFNSGDDPRRAINLLMSWAQGLGEYEALRPIDEEDKSAWLKTPMLSSTALTHRSERDANAILANRRFRLTQTPSAPAQAVPIDRTDEYEARKEETIPLRLDGCAGSPIWTMEEADGTIGLRLDCGDAGMVRLTVTQAQEVISALNFQIAHHSAQPASPEREQPVDEELVEAMHNAFEGGLLHYQRHYVDDFVPHDCAISGMTAALHVAADRLNKERDAEWRAVVVRICGALQIRRIEDILSALRRTRLAASEQPRTEPA